MSEHLRATYSFCASLAFAPCCVQANAAGVTEEVLNPRGAIAPDDLHEISPRLAGFCRDGSTGTARIANHVHDRGRV